MEKKTLFALLLFLFLWSFVYESHGNKQVKALDNLHKVKISKNPSVDRSHFEPPRHLKRETLVVSQEGLKEKDKIEKLPGQPYVNFDQYGGYVTVNKTAGRALYYYFVEARNSSKESLPLLLWLNGGPGCSSLGYGAMQELGPFRVNSDGKTLFLNKLAWNQAANVLFLESPAGVGYSYSNTTWDNANGGDKQTAEDNYMFLLNWLERFPEYKERDFFISGESYAGHYVPELAHTILHHNHMANKTLINLKGILVGNGVINDETDNKGMYDYFGTHAIVSDETIYEVQKYCDFSPNATTQPKECNDALTEVDDNVEAIDIYNIYAHQCLDPSLTSTPKRMSWQTIDPCSEYYTTAYMNRPDVQEAFHANITKLHYDWQPCSDVLQNWLDSPSTMIPLLKEFMKNNLRVWIFSGDTDARVPITSTRYSINSMKLPVKTRFHPWIHRNEVAGYVEVYKGDLTLTTIRGAGHQVPSYQPQRALALVSHFLSGKSLPSD